MFINKLIELLHKYTSNLYENSFILKQTDNIIFGLIILTFLLSVFVNSDIIGYCAIVIAVLTVVRIIFNPSSKLEPKPFELFLLAYFMILLVALAGSSLFYLSLKGFVKTLAYLSFYLSVVHHFKYNKNHILPILMVIAGCTMFESLIGISQNFAKVDEISGWQDVSNLNPEEVITRVYGTLQPLNPNLLGGYFVMTIPALIGLFGYYLKNREYIISAIFGTGAVLTCVTLFLTGCRGAYLGLFVILLLAFVISFKIFQHKYKKRFISTASALAGVGAFLIMAITPLRMRVLSIFAMRNDSSNSFRFNVYKSSFEMFKDNWVVGIGHGNQNFREVYGLYMKTGFDALSAYNIYLETALEAGIFALIAFLGFLIVLICDGIKYLIKSDDVKNIVVVAVPLLSIAGTMVHGLVDTVFFRPQLQIVFWTMCAILSNKLYSEQN